VAEPEWDTMEALRQAFASEAGRATAAHVAVLAPQGGIRSMIFEVDDLLRAG
jgi:hypothetical protein